MLWIQDHGGVRNRKLTVYTGAPWSNSQFIHSPQNSFARRRRKEIEHAFCDDRPDFGDDTALFVRFAFGRFGETRFGEPFFEAPDLRLQSVLRFGGNDCGRLGSRHHPFGILEYLAPAGGLPCCFLGGRGRRGAAGSPGWSPAAGRTGRGRPGGGRAARRGCRSR